MKRAAILVAMLGVGTLALGQQQPASQTPPAAQTGTPSATATPEAKHPPQAKTQPEFEAYKAANANPNDGPAMEKAADDFAAKFPDSELRPILYRTAMHAYQAANNADKMMEMGRKVLKIDPDDPEALIGVAQVIAERTRDSDIDKDQRTDEAAQMAERSLKTVDTDIVAPAGTPQDKLDAYKAFLVSSAYSILGTISYNRDKFPEAEGYFRKSIDALPSQPDPVAVLRLALSLDRQEKYEDALKSANQAVQLTDENSAAGGLARQERDRLVQLTGGTPAPASKPAPPPTSPSPQK
jgi:tetratricopeptide (TPR) repeat protein